MLDIIQAHLDVIERLQASLEAQILEALGSVDPRDIVDRADELPAEIAQELRDWISRNALQQLVDESQRFLRDIEDEADEDIAVNEDKIRGLIGLLFDDYITAVTVTLTAAFALIRNKVNLQISLGRDDALILAELQGKTGLGSRLKALSRQVIVETDSFVGSAGGLIPIATSKDPLVWITVLDKRVCDDCDERHGQTQTTAEWIDLGLPRTGWSVCTGYCRCILVPIGAVAKFGMPEPVIRPRRK